jgi:predicted kinase
MLISLGGLPGTGKTTIACELARQIQAMHVSVDSIERTIRDSRINTQSGEVDTYRIAYGVAFAIAADNLQLGKTVIADCVNPLPWTRNAWLDVAKAAGVRTVEVEIVCSDEPQYRSRLPAAIPGAALPRWEQVARNYQPWDRGRVVIDTANRTVEDAVTLLKQALHT